MLTQELINKVLSKRVSDKEKSNYYNNLFISLNVLDWAIENYLKTLLSDKFQAYGCAKLTVFELWTVRTILRKFDLDLKYFDDVLFPNIKAFRDALAHIDERIDRKILVNKGKVPVIWEKKSIAGGNVVSNDGGKSWHANGSVFNISFHGENGIQSPFGLVNDYLVINTEKGMIDFKLSAEIFIKFNQWLSEQFK